MLDTFYIARKQLNSRRITSISLLLCKKNFPFVNVIAIIAARKLRFQQVVSRMLQPLAIIDVRLFSSAQVQLLPKGIQKHTKTKRTCLHVSITMPLLLFLEDSIANTVADHLHTHPSSTTTSRWTCTSKKEVSSTGFQTNFRRVSNRVKPSMLSLQL